ncbi:MAG: dTMP kinase [Steroidobacteraceae bacterium]
MSRGKFITLEGIEGAGKSTAASFVCRWLQARGVTALATREPGGTPLAERIRQIVLERGTETVPPVSETLLMFAARSLHVHNVILPALARGDWVVCDRFTDATRAYQGSGRGVDSRLLDTLAAAVHRGLEPDCTLLFDIPAAAGLARARGRSGSNADRFEAETLGYFASVRAGYLALARAAPQRFRVVDAAAPLAEVERAVGAALTGLLHQESLA